MIWPLVGAQGLIAESQRWLALRVAIWVVLSKSLCRLCRSRGRSNEGLSQTIPDGTAASSTGEVTRNEGALVLFGNSAA